ncbi:MAG: hypothetical protein U1E45_19415 [Geminicoccaceae bacterium]
MEPAYISALAALAGSAIGALASLTTSWLTQRVQAKQSLRAQDLARREAVYGDFIREASRLFADAFEHELDDPSKLVQLYATVSIIRLFGEPETLTAAEGVMRKIGATYFAPNKDLKLFSDITPNGELDPVFEFSAACRRELRSLRI